MKTINRATFISIAMTIVVLQALAARQAVQAAFVPKQHPLMDIQWKQLQQEGTLKSGELVIDDRTHQGALKVESPVKVKEATTGGMPTLVPLFDIDAPKIEKRVYALSGSVRYENVEGPAFLEMWSYFPDGSQFFSRTAANSGPMQLLQGTSGWRAFQLPFELADDPQSPRPNRLVVNVVFQGTGTVWLSDLTLSEFNTLHRAMSPGAWWGDSTGGLVGGIGGTILGLMGALMGFLVARGMARKLVLGGTASAVALGFVLLCTGIVATILQQPYGVFYPLLLGGGLCLILGIVGLVVSRQRYAHLELRRMQSLDAER